MRYLLPAVLGALSLIYVDGVAAQDVPSCVPACANTVRGQFSQYGCVSADDAACLCAKPDFAFGIRDCGQSGCGSTDAQIQSFLAAGFCQGQQLAFTPTGALPSSTPPPSTTTGPPETSSLPGTSSAPTSPPSSTAPNSETAPQSSSSPSTAPPTTATPTPTGPASVPSQTSVSSTATPPHSNSTIPVSTPTSPPSITTSVATSTSATASSTSVAAPAGGLSQGAAIGIGVGVAGGVVAIAFAGVFFFLKNRSRTHDSFDISQPPPSSGRGQGAFEKYSNDLELVSNRYEDMVPRQQPRAMV
ncbi:hypothetical protein V8C35DRAFT_306193 [Trichoderma chlorosporum]